MGQPIHPEPRRIRCRKESEQAAETRWARGVALPPHYRKPSGDAPNRDALTWMRDGEVPLGDQPHRRLCHRFLCGIRGHFIHILHDRCGGLPRLPLPDPTSIPIQALVKIISRRALRRLSPRVRSALRNLGFIPGAPVDAARPPPAVTEPRNWNFGEIPDDMMVCRGDAHCIPWMFRSATDGDVIFRTAQFAADMILYPEIADVLEPRILANHFFGCLEDGRVIPDRLEHTNVIGLALASVLSVQLCVDPGRGLLQDISHTIHIHTDCIPLSEPMFLPGVAILRIVSRTPEPVEGGTFPIWEDLSGIPIHLSTTQKLSLSRMVLQTVWRWRRVQDATNTLNLKAIDLFCKGLMTNGGHIPPALRIDCFLIMAISLGDPIDNVKALFAPNTECVSPLSFHRLH